MKLGTAVLLGAILSPTDPVLAASVQAGPPGKAKKVSRNSPLRQNSRFKRCQAQRNEVAQSWKVGSRRCGGGLSLRRKARSNLWRTVVKRLSRGDLEKAVDFRLRE